MILPTLFALSALASAAEDITAHLKTCAHDAISAPAEITRSLKCDEKKAFAAKVTANAKKPAEKDLAAEIVREADECVKAVQRLRTPVDRAKLCACLKDELNRAIGMAGASGVRLDPLAMRQTAQIKCVMRN